MHGSDDYAWLGAGTSGKMTEMTEPGSEKPGKAAIPPARAPSTRVGSETEQLFL